MKWKLDTLVRKLYMAVMCILKASSAKEISGCESFDMLKKMIQPSW